MKKQPAPPGPGSAWDTITVRLGRLAFEALGGYEVTAAEVGRRLVRAIRLYLAENGTAEAAWAYPALVQEQEGETIGVELRVEASLWRALERAADGQAVSARQLATHASLYYAAAQDAGRLTQRILDDLDAGDAGEAPREL